MRKRLIELLLKSDPLHERDLDDDLVEGEVEALADYLLTEGVIVPPVKAGDTIYRIYAYEDYAKIFEAKVVSVEYLADNDIYLHLLHYNGYAEPVPFAKYIHEIFLTKEEAENALAEREGER